MTKILKFNFTKRKPLTSLLGLAFDGSRLDGVVLRRQNDALQVAQTFNATLTLDPLTNEPELVGREILNHLEAAGIRERRCVVAVPQKWALTAQTQVPAIPEVDVAGFLQIEAERGFPCDVTTLRVATSRYVTPTGQQHALFVGIPAAHLERLEQVLRAAKLKPVSFTLASIALQPPTRDGLVLVIGTEQVSLQITGGGGVAALRMFDGQAPELVARETRITLGQLPVEVNHIRIFGPPEPAEDLAEELRQRFAAVEIVREYALDEFGVTIPPATGVSPAFSLAAWQLVGRLNPFEFLPPKFSAWEQLTTRYVSGKLRTAGAVAAAVVVLVAGAFGIQQFQLWRLNSRWRKMAATVHELENVQSQIRQYRPWFDDSFLCLTMLRQLTMAFSEDGAVTAKTLEIRDQNTVSCFGTARDTATLLRMLNQLRAADGVRDVKVDQIRGKSPLQFTFDFHFGTGGSNEN